MSERFDWTILDDGSLQVSTVAAPALSRVESDRLKVRKYVKLLRYAPSEGRTQAILQALWDSVGGVSMTNTNTDLYARCAEALNITRAHFAAWLDGDPFAGYNLNAIPEDALETLRGRDIITEDEYAELIN